MFVNHDFQKQLSETVVRNSCQNQSSEMVVKDGCQKCSLDNLVGHIHQKSLQNQSSEMVAENQPGRQPILPLPARQPLHSTKLENMKMSSKFGGKNVKKGLKCFL